MAIQSLVPIFSPINSKLFYLMGQPTQQPSNIRQASIEVSLQNYSQIGPVVSELSIFKVFIHNIYP